MGLLLPLITILFILLTFFDILLLFEKVFDEFFTLNSLLFLICLLERLGLRRFLIFKHTHVISETIIESSKWFALSFLDRLSIVKRRPIDYNKWLSLTYLALKRMLR